MMKSTSAVAALLLGASFTVASPVQETARAVMTLMDTNFRAAEAPKPSKCSSGGFTLTLSGPSGSGATPYPGFDFFTFCSDFLQPTATLVQTTVVVTTTTVTAATSTVSKGSTATVVAPGTTVTSLCPVPTSGVPVCGSHAWGYAENSIQFLASEDPLVCHQLCLENLQCNSFQIEDTTSATSQCTLYNTTADANDTIVGAAPFLFYDWDCPDLLPTGCGGKPTTKAGAGASATASSTHVPQTYTIPGGAPKPIRATAAAILPRTAAQATLPAFLAPFGSSSVSDICDCIVTSPSPTAYIVSSTKVSSVVSVQATATTTVMGVTTTTIGGSTVTVVSSVS